ncbi:hypothetical protein BHE74_00035375 [Ensete ventricosum]|nr:hypothetical protein BHE74_00035375 [Ensete ventricosum]
MVPPIPGRTYQSTNRSVRKSPATERSTQYPFLATGKGGCDEARRGEGVGAVCCDEWGKREKRLCNGEGGRAGEGVRERFRELSPFIDKEEDAASTKKKREKKRKKVPRVRCSSLVPPHSLLPMGEESPARFITHRRFLLPARGEGTR